MDKRKALFMEQNEDTPFPLRMLSSSNLCSDLETGTGRSDNCSDSD